MFDQVKLKRNGWHQKIQMWTFGWENEKDLPFKNNFCPYFWLTIFCCLVSPFTLVIKLIKNIFTGFFQGLYFIGEIIDRYICRPLFDYQIEHLSDEDVYTLYSLSRNYDLRGKNWDKWHAWTKKQGKDWKKIAEEIAPKVEQKLYTERQKRYLKRDAREVKLEAIEKKIEAARLTVKKAAQVIPKAKTKAIFNTIIKYTKVITTIFMYILGAAVVTGAGYLLYLLGQFLYSINWAIAIDWELMKVIGWSVLGALSVFSLGYLVIWLVNKCNVTLCPKWLKRAIHTSAEGFCDGIIWISDKTVIIGRYIVAPFAFFIAFIKAYKEENCPAIVWEE